MPEKMPPCPPNWKLENWTAHLARIDFIKEMGQGHYSRTDARWHVKRFRENLLAEERARVLKLIARQYKAGEKDPKVNIIAEEIKGDVQP